MGVGGWFMRAGNITAGYIDMRAGNITVSNIGMRHGNMIVSYTVVIGYIITVSYNGYTSW